MTIFLFDMPSKDALEPLPIFPKVFRFIFGPDEISSVSYDFKTKGHALVDHSISESDAGDAEPWMAVTPKIFPAWGKQPFQFLG